MNKTLNKQEADLIQFIIWCLNNASDPMVSIRYEVKHKGVDMDALWTKFILSSNIDWFSQDSSSVAV